MAQEDGLINHILEIDGLRLNLKEVEETLLAIRSGEVDALVVRCGDGIDIGRSRCRYGTRLPFDLPRFERCDLLPIAFACGS